MDCYGFFNEQVRRLTSPCIIPYSRPGFKDSEARIQFSSRRRRSSFYQSIHIAFFADRKSVKAKDKDCSFCILCKSWALLAHLEMGFHHTLPPALPVPAKNAALISLTSLAAISIMISVPKRDHLPGSILRCSSGSIFLVVFPRTRSS